MVYETLTTQRERRFVSPRLGGLRATVLLPRRGFQSAGFALCFRHRGPRGGIDSILDTLKSLFVDQPPGFWITVIGSTIAGVLSGMLLAVGAIFLNNFLMSKRIKLNKDFRNWRNPAARIIKSVKHTTRDGRTFQIDEATEKEAISVFAAFLKIDSIKNEEYEKNDGGLE